MTQGEKNLHRIIIWNVRFADLASRSIWKAGGLHVPSNFPQPLPQHSKFVHCKGDCQTHPLGPLCRHTWPRSLPRWKSLKVVSTIEMLLFNGQMVIMI